MMMRGNVTRVPIDDYDILYNIYNTHAAINFFLYFSLHEKNKKFCNMAARSAIA